MPKVDDRFWFVASVNVRPVRTRTWGFFFSKEKAIESVKRSVVSMSENGYYSHAVIESVTPSDSTAPTEDSKWQREELWFALDPESGEAESCEKPVELRRCVDFTLG